MSAILPTLYLISHPHRNHPYPPSSVVSSSSRFFSHPYTQVHHPPSPSPILHLPPRFLSTFPATASKALDYLPLISARVAHLLPRLSRLVRDRDHHLPRFPSSFSISFLLFPLPFFRFLFLFSSLFSLFHPPSQRSFIRSFVRFFVVLTTHPGSLPIRWLFVYFFLSYVTPTILVTFNASTVGVLLPYIPRGIDE